MEPVRLGVLSVAKEEASALGKKGPAINQGSTLVLPPLSSVFFCLHKLTLASKAQHVRTLDTKVILSLKHASQIFPRGFMAGFPRTFCGSSKLMSS